MHDEDDGEEITSIKDNLLHQIVEQLNISTVIVNLNAESIEYANPSIEELLGYSEGELADSDLSTIFKNENLEKVQAIISVLSNQLDGCLNEDKIHLRRKSGRNMVASLSGQVTRISSEFKIVFIIHDITELENLHQQQENANKQLSHLSKLADIGFLAAGVAHEINNPLATVKLCAETMEMMCDSEGVTKEDIKKQVLSVLKNTDRIARIVKQMRGLVRDDELELELTPLNVLISESLQLCQTQFIENDIEFSENFSNSAAIANCDPYKIEQVLINVITNAIYAVSQVSDKKGRKIQISIDEKPEAFEINIWNSGSEIPHKVREHIFTPFFTDKPVGDGTGLGLSISHNIMKSHGGDLSFWSYKNKGTNFCLTLPKPRGKSRAGEAA